jgi:hypothetical protein
MKQHTAVLTGIFGILLVFGFIFAGCTNPTNDEGDNNNPNTPPINENITVYMQKPSGWSSLYAYVWDDSGKEYTASAPGTELTETSNGFYSYQAQSAEYGYINVRFTDGGYNSTLDILGIDKDTWYKDAEIYSAISQTVVQSSDSSSFTTPQFTASEKTDSTITLTWGPIPGVDGYILYDEWIEFDDYEEEIPGSEYWHFQKAFSPDERSILDDNYGEYLDPETIYTWKLVAVKYKDGANLSGLDSLDPDYITEDDYSQYYTVVYNFGPLEVETNESSLPAPANLRVTSTGATSVELAWDAVPNAGYYMVWWYDDDSDEWLYIEEAYDNQYIDSDEEFIFPGSSYTYLVVAHNERTYSNDSNEVTAYTTYDYSAPMNNSANVSDIVRAVSSTTPSAPSYVSAGPNPYAANQINVNWYPVSGAQKYEVGLFNSSPGASTTPISGTLKTISGTFYSTVYYTYTSVPTSKGAYYIGVRAVNGSKKSPWKAYSYSVPVFPKISIQSSTATTSGNYKKFTIKMNASWKSGASYQYVVRYEGYDSKLGRITGSATGSPFTSNTITFNAPKGPKYTVYITPKAGGVNSSTLTVTK